MLAVDASFSGVSSFTTDTLLDEIYTIEALSQESQTSLDKDSNTNADLSEPETSSNKLTFDYKLSAKRLRRHSKRSHYFQSKRRDGFESGALN